MVIGICKIQIHISQIFSLKEKRQIIKSLINKINSRFNVSIAEVGLNDNHNNSIIGFCVVSNSRSHADSCINNIINYMENDGRFDICDISTECQNV